MGKVAASTIYRFETIRTRFVASRVWSPLLVLLVVAPVLFVQLGAAKLWDIDEPRNAGCAREMLERNDYVTPLFNGELRTHKPILLYWEMMLAYRALGIHEFSARLPSVILGLGTCLLTWAIGRRLFSNRVGVLAGCALGTNIMFVMAARAATPDATLIFWMTASLAAFVYAVFPGSVTTGRSDAGDGVPQQPPAANIPLISRWQAIAAYSLMGAATLAKGPVGFVIPTAIAGLFFLVITRRERGRLAEGHGATSRWVKAVTRVRAGLGWFASVFHPLHLVRTTWRMRPLTALVCLSVVALPWYVWVGVRTDGEWLRGFFIEHNLERATRAMEGHRGSALWYYPAAILVGFFPWSLFALPIVLDLRLVLRHERHRRAATFLLSWVAVVVGAFSIAKTKLPSYVTPCYPALALLVAHLLVRWSRRESPISVRWMKLAYACSIIVGVGMLIALPLLAARFLPGNGILGAMGILPMVAGAAGWWMVSRHRPWLPRFHALSAVLIIAVAFGWGVVRVSRQQTYDRLLRRFPDDERTPVVALGCLEPSWVFYSGRVIPEVGFPVSGVASADIDWKPGGWYRNMPPVDRYWERHPDAYVLMTEEGWHRLKCDAQSHQIVARARRFLKPGTVLLVRRSRLSGAVTSTR